MFKIRPYNPTQASDLTDVYKICLLTADNGGDASHLYSHPEMIGDFFVAPYCELEPTLCFLLEDSQGVCGYIVAALDTENFNQRMNATWLPKTRLKYPLSTTNTNLSKNEKWLTDLIHTDLKIYGNFVSLIENYPSHLHIDLLPRAQKQGQGKLLMTTLWTALKQAGSPGVNLGVSSNNHNAIAFYKHIGYTDSLTFDGSIIMTKEL